MASPMRLLLSPRLSSISPKSPLKVKSPVSRSPKARKQLPYSIRIPKGNAEVNLGSTNIQISITNSASPQIVSENVSLLLNTPIRERILDIGLPQINQLSILGRGSFGIVVKGVYKGCDVAVKVVRSRGTMNELNALHLRHQNIVRTIDVIRKDSSHSIIIMEYLPQSKHLQYLIDFDQYAMTFTNTLNFLIGITNGLLFCHSNLLVHLDLKPGNILVTRHDADCYICKLCDFGNSQFIPSTTSNYICMGTVQYTAPELLRGEAPEFASDIFSLGIMMWQLRYRQNPYECLETRETIIYNVVKFNFRPPMGAITDEIHDDFSILYQNCWHPLSTERPTLTNIRTHLIELKQKI